MGHLPTIRYLVDHSRQTAGWNTWEEKRVLISIPPRRLHSPSMMRWGRSWNPVMSNWIPSPGQGRTYNTRSHCMVVLAHSFMHCPTMRMGTNEPWRILTTCLRAIRIPNSPSPSMRNQSGTPGQGCGRTHPLLRCLMSSTSARHTTASRRETSHRTRD